MDEPYGREREDAQMRKIELSMNHRLGLPGSADPHDRALFDPTPARADNRYDPLKW